MTADSHQSRTLFPLFLAPSAELGGEGVGWRGCRWFNFRFFALAWDLCPPGGTKGRQGVRTWLHFYLFPILYFWASSSIRGSTPALPCRPREQVTDLCRTSLGPWASVPVLSAAGRFSAPSGKGGAWVVPWGGQSRWSLRLWGSQRVFPRPQRTYAHHREGSFQSVLPSFPFSFAFRKSFFNLFRSTRC